MNNHIHYGDWTIEWSEDAPERVKFWIQTKLSIPEQDRIELLNTFVAYFETPQMGCYRCKRIIDSIVFEQHELFYRLPFEYLESLQPPAPQPEPTPVDRESEDSIPF
jgi:hypothetical protein